MLLRSEPWPDMDMDIHDRLKNLSHTLEAADERASQSWAESGIRDWIAWTRRGKAL